MKNEHTYWPFPVVGKISKETQTMITTTVTVPTVVVPALPISTTTKKLLKLPFFAGVTLDEIDKIVNKVMDKRAKKLEMKNLPEALV